MCLPVGRLIEWQRSVQPTDAQDFDQFSRTPLRHPPGGSGCTKLLEPERSCAEHLSGSWGAEDSL